MHVQVHGGGGQNFRTGGERQALAQLNESAYVATFATSDRIEDYHAITRCKDLRSVLVQARNSVF